MQLDDDARLLHIREASEQALDFVSGYSRPDFDTNRMLVFALVKCVEIVGEAANSMSEAGRARCPGIDWPAIIGMRHRLVHAYHDINLDVLWSTVTEDLPDVLAELRKAPPPA